MSDLSAGARDLLKSAREHHRPTEQTRQRIRDSIDRSIAAGAEPTYRDTPPTEASPPARRGTTIAVVAIAVAVAAADASYSASSSARASASIGVPATVGSSATHAYI